MSRRLPILSDQPTAVAGHTRVEINPNDPAIFMRQDDSNDDDGASTHRRKPMNLQEFRFATVNQLRAVMIVLIVTLGLLLAVLGVGIWVGVAIVGPMVADASAALAQASALARDTRIPLIMQRIDALSESAVLGADYVKQGAAAFLPASASEWQAKAATLARIAGMVGTGLENADVMMGEAKTLASDALETMTYVKAANLLENSVLLVTATADFLRVNLPLIRTANTTRAVTMAADLADAAQDLIDTFRQTGITVKLKK